MMTWAVAFAAVKLKDASIMSLAFFSIIADAATIIVTASAFVR